MFVTIVKPGYYSDYVAKSIRLHASERKARLAARSAASTLSVYTGGQVEVRQADGTILAAYGIDGLRQVKAVRGAEWRKLLASEAR